MFRTLSLETAIGCEHNIIQHGTYFLTNDQTQYNSVISSVINDLKGNSEPISYTEKLNLWSKNKICVTEIWIGDTTTLAQVGSDVKYKTAFGEPKAEITFSIYPLTVLEAIELNLHNINNAISYLGSFDSFKSSYIQFLNENQESLFLIDRITRDITTLEEKGITSSYYGFSDYYWPVNKWYESFRNKQESLNLANYNIWIDVMPDVKNYSSKSSNPAKQLIYYLDELRDILNASEGYLVYLKLPFLYDIRETFIHKLFPNSETTSESTEEIDKEIKLMWASTNRSLYDLFAQLTLIDVKPGKRLIGNTLKELARFLSEHVEGLPSAETVERELEKMRELGGVEKAKRGRVDLHITRDSD